MRRASAADIQDDDSVERKDSLTTPLLLETGGYERGDEEDTDDQADSPLHDRGQDSSFRQLGIRRAARFLRSQSTRRPSARATSVWTTTPGHRPQDYRSEGEQPSTERNGNRRPLSESKQDSFRLPRMPKRGGRKRLRRARSVRRKIRVSSYCVSRELNTSQLLRWLEQQPNRRLSQSIRAEGGSVPQGPVGAATITATAAAAAMASVSMRNPDPRGPGGSVQAGTPASKPTQGAGASTIEQLEWMDSLYIDVIHSTTDLRGGIRKARALARHAWQDVVNEADGSGDDYGIHSSRRGGRWSLARERDDDRDEEEDDDILTHKDVMYFPYGAVVFWGCSEAEEKNMLSNLHRFMVGKVSDRELEESFDDMTFVYRHPDARKSVPLKNDEITLDTRDPAEKLAYSCALAQSAKLFVFEERLNNTIESTAKYPQMLASTGKIPLTEGQIGRLVGQVLCEQNEVNLHSDILDTPEYFWEEDAWEPAYEALTAYLDMPLRVDNLNKRLCILKELLDVLSTQSTNAHATRLEVIIIYLIFVEVAIELVWNVIIKDIFRLVGDEERC